MITLNLQSIITAGAVVGALTALIALFVKIVRWIDHQKEQDDDIEDIRRQMTQHNRETKEEQTLLTYGILACLKGLNEKGCTGSVTEAINRIEKHLNQKAHE